MSLIKPNSYVEGNYSEVSEFCNKHDKPIFVTKDGKLDLVVLSIETFEKLVGKIQLYKLLNEGMDTIKNKEAILDINKGLEEE